MHEFFILIHLLHSSTCFGHYFAHLQEDNCVDTTSGIVTLFGWLFSTQVTRGLVPCVLNSYTKRVTIPDAVLTQLSSWRWAQYCPKHVEECNKCIKIKNLCIMFVKNSLSKYQVSYKYSYSSWWWTWGGPKHIKVINKIDEIYWEYIYINKYISFI